MSRPGWSPGCSRPRLGTAKETRPGETAAPLRAGCCRARAPSHRREGAPLAHGETLGLHLDTQLSIVSDLLLPQPETALPNTLEPSQNNSAGTATLIDEFTASWLTNTGHLQVDCTTVCQGWQNPKSRRANSLILVIPPRGLENMPCFPACKGRVLNI